MTLLSPARMILPKLMYIFMFSHLWENGEII